MYRGRIQLNSPMLWTIGFMVTFVIGGMTGVLLAVPPADFVLHNSLFLIAHFHNAIIGGVVFGYLAGITYWFPKAFGFKLDEKWGKRAFWCWFVGFYTAFMPLYVLGFMGMTRRLNHTDNPAWQPWLIVAVIGAAIIACGIASQLIQIFVSVRNRHALADLTGDPWGGRTLEWATSSPPAHYNFARVPVIRDIDAFADMKARGEVLTQVAPSYEKIHMPKNTGAGIILAGFSLVFGFALIWYIWWLAAASFLGLIVTAIAHTFNYDRDFYITAEEVTETENARTAVLARLGA
jgi:cytochrome o ubiquinol oxidase subunit 1